MWKERFKDYTTTRASITDTELDSYTSGQWSDWCQAWDAYVKSGGTRPPNRPPI